MLKIRDWPFSGRPEWVPDIASVLVPVTGEAPDDEVIRFACSIVGPRKGTLHVLYVIEVERGLPIDVEIGPATAKGEQVLGHMEELAKELKCRSEAELVQARQARSAIVQESADRKVDAIVMRAPHRQGRGLFSLGQTVPYVLEHAPCLVIVWRDGTERLEANGQGR